MFQNITLSDLIPIFEPVAINTLDGVLNITPAQALAYLQESEAEHPEQPFAWHVDDAIGKFEHGMRDGELAVPSFVRNGIDAFWPLIKELVTPVVTAVAAQSPAASAPTG